MPRKRIVVLGASIAGLSFAREARDKLSQSFEVTLVNPEPRTVYKPLLTYIAAGLRKPEEAFIDLDGRISTARLEASRVVGIDTGNRTVDLEDGGRLEYDYLVIAVGAEPDNDAIPGLSKANSNPWTLEGATRLSQAIASGAKRVLVGSFKPPYPCPPAPIELAGLIAKASKASVTLGFPGPKPLPPLGEEVSSKLEALIESSGVHYIRDFKPIEVDPDAKVLVHEAGRVEFDALGLIPPYKPSSLLIGSGIAKEGGWPPVIVDKGFRHARLDDVYVIGDAAIAQTGAPMAGFLAGFMAREAAADIASREGLAGPSGGSRAKAKCFVDHIDDGSAIFCDFTEVVMGGGKPHCHVIAEGGLVGEYKLALERFWKAFKV